MILLILGILQTELFQGLAGKMGLELESIKIKNEKLMFTCESRKATLINLMICLQNKYL